MGEYLSRALAHRTALTEPKDPAWLLASYARDALHRVEAAGDAPSLHAVRTALEEALGIRFEGERGVRFFRSTLVQRLRARGGPQEADFVRQAYRLFDNRWLYWEAGTNLLDRPRPEYRPHVFEGNLWLAANKREIQEFTHGNLIRHVGGWKLGNWGTHFFPLWLQDDDVEMGKEATSPRLNLSGAAQRYIERLGIRAEDLFHHVLSVFHDPAYRAANAGAFRMEWPRIPLPGWPDGDAADAAMTLTQSAARGRILAQLLDPDTPVPGVTTGALRPEIVALAAPATTDGRNMIGDDFALTAGWGHYGSGGAVMPGQGRLEERPFTVAEHTALGGTTPASPLHSPTTFDIYLNGRTYWRNVPAAVWRYKLGGYQVLKKWLSYRERNILARPLTLDEVQHFTDTARRIAAILTLTAT